MLVHNVCILLQITSNIISFKILINLCYRLNLFCYFSAFNYKKFARPKTPCSAFFKMTYFFSPGFVCNQCKIWFIQSQLLGTFRQAQKKACEVHFDIFDDISSIHVMCNVYKPFHIRLHHGTPRCIWIFLIKMYPNLRLHFLRIYVRCLRVTINTDFIIMVMSYKWFFIYI